MVVLVSAAPETTDHTPYGPRARHIHADDMRLDSTAGIQLHEVFEYVCAYSLTTEAVHYR